MTWCKDSARDAAVRAAEDGRSAPLPTLGEAIVLAFGFDKFSAQRACDEVKSWPEDVQKDCRFVLGNLLEQGVERLQALVEAWRYGKGLLAARYPDMIPKSVSASSATDHENKVDGMPTKSEMQAADYRAEAQSGMRTERVVLEITQFNNGGYKPASEWDWDFFLRGEALTDGESVRVVEEAHFDDLAQVAMERDAAIRDGEERVLALREQWRLSREACYERAAERDAAISEREDLREQLESVACRAATAETALEARNVTPGEGSCAAQAASGGGEQEPVGWMCEWTDYTSLHLSKIYAEAEGNGTVVPQPLYRAPPQPRGWLTEDERQIIAGIADDDEYTEEGQDIAKGLLARSSPPEVVLPTVFSRSTLGDRLLVEQQVRQALAAAGVAVKEVGK